MLRRWEYTRAYMMSLSEPDNWLATKVWWQVDLASVGNRFGNGESAKAIFPLTTFKTFEAMIEALDTSGWDLVSHQVLSYLLDVDGHSDATCIEYIFRRPFKKLDSDGPDLS